MLTIVVSASAPTTTVHRHPSSDHERTYRLPVKWRTVHWRYGLAEHNCDACCTTEPRATVHKTPCVACIYQLHTIDTIITRAIVRSRGGGKQHARCLGSSIPAFPLVRRNYMSTASSPSPSASSPLPYTSTGRARAPPHGEGRPVAETPPLARATPVSKTPPGNSGTTARRILPGVAADTTVVAQHDTKLEQVVWHRCLLRSENVTACPLFGFYLTAVVLDVIITKNVPLEPPRGLFPD